MLRPDPVEDVSQAEDHRGGPPKKRKRNGEDEQEKRLEHKAALPVRRAIQSTRLATQATWRELAEQLETVHLEQEEHLGSLGVVIGDEVFSALEALYTTFDA